MRVRGTRLDLERHRREILVPHQRDLALAVGHVGERPGQLLHRERQRRERQGRPDDVLVGGIAEGPPDRLVVARVVVRLRRPGRHDQRPRARLQVDEHGVLAGRDSLVVDDERHLSLQPCRMVAPCHGERRRF